MIPEARAVLEVPDCIDAAGRFSPGHDWKATFVNSHRGAIQIDVVCSNCERLATMRLASRPGRTETKGLRVDLSAPDVPGEFGAPQTPKRTRVDVATIERVDAGDQPCAWEEQEPDGPRGCDAVPALLRVVDEDDREFWLCRDHAHRFLLGEDAPVHGDPPTPGQVGPDLILTADPDPPPRPANDRPTNAHESPATVRPRPVIGQPTTPKPTGEERPVLHVKTDKPGRCLVIKHGANCYAEGLASLVTLDGDRFGICVDCYREFTNTGEIAAGWPESGQSFTLFMTRFLNTVLRAQSAERGLPWETNG